MLVLATRWQFLLLFVPVFLALCIAVIHAVIGSFSSGRTFTVESCVGFMMILRMADSSTITLWISAVSSSVIAGATAWELIQKKERSPARVIRA